MTTESSEDIHTKLDAKSVEDTINTIDLDKLRSLLATLITTDPYRASSGDPMLHYAIKTLMIQDVDFYPDRWEMLDFLISVFTSQVEQRDKQGRTALEVVVFDTQASRGSKIKTLESIWAIGARPNPILSNGKKMEFKDYQGLKHRGYFDQAMEKYWTPEKREQRQEKDSLVQQALQRLRRKALIESQHSRLGRNSPLRERLSTYDKNVFRLPLRLSGNPAPAINPLTTLASRPALVASASSSQSAAGAMDETAGSTSTSKRKKEEDTMQDSPALEPKRAMVNPGAAIASVFSTAEQIARISLTTPTAMDLDTPSPQ